MADEPVSLTVASNEVEAEMIRGMLSSAGIDSMEGPSNAGVAPGLITGGATEIFVRRSQLEDAQTLLESDVA
ncbi:MAG: putative signal transducing protein [Gaiellaceae bacterium]